MEGTHGRLENVVWRGGGGNVPNAEHVKPSKSYFGCRRKLLLAMDSAVILFTP